MKRVVVTGGTGFIGMPLCRLLADRGYEVLALTRQPDRSRKLFGRGVACLGWDGKSAKTWVDVASGAYAIINLAGDNIGQGRWTREKKERILHSRLEAGRAVARAVGRAREKPRLLLQASAVGYYGPTETLVDENAPAGQGFLAEVATQWEASTAPVEREGVRRVLLRTAMVLGRGGALAHMLPSFRWFLGAVFGSGQQGVSWIHLRDEIGAILHLLESEEASGPYNLSSLNPVTHEEFCQTLASVLRRPCSLRIPARAARLLLGEMADQLLLSGQFAEPARLVASGYRFEFSGLRAALEDILSR
jgi:uncharacterized protein (TIGR01777 family)